MAGTHILTRQDLSADDPTSATVGVASAQAVARNLSRRGLVLTNLSAGRISLGIGTTAVLNRGITLPPNGGSWQMNECTFTLEAIHAIAAIADSVLAVQEFTR